MDRIGSKEKLLSEAAPRSDEPLDDVLQPTERPPKRNFSFSATLATALTTIEQVMLVHVVHTSQDVSHKRTTPALSMERVSLSPVTRRAG